MIDFIVTYTKDRKHHLDGLKTNLKKFYDTNFKLIICEQLDPPPFKRGQLINLGFKKTTNETLVIADSDCRVEKFIDFENLILTNKPFRFWNRLVDADEDVDGNFSNTKLRGELDGWSFVCLTKNDYINSGGHSNLTFGWGKDDNIFNNRVKFIKLNNALIHIRHPYNHPTVYMPDNKATLFNSIIMNTDCSRDKLFDGYNQTIADEVLLEKESNFEHWGFSNIRVVDDYNYNILYNDGLELIKNN
jgi:hypothetical protein